MLNLENKIPPPVITSFFALVIWAIAEITPAIAMPAAARKIAAVSFVLIGLYFDYSAIASFIRAETTVNPHKPKNTSRLVTSGMYRFSRNPMYAGLLCYLLALAAYLASPLSLAGAAGFILYMNRYQIAPEERALAELFGTEYEAYKAKVRRWI